MKVLKALNGTFYLLMGIAIPIISVIILFKGDFGNFDTKAVSSIFHLFSEALLAIACLLTAIGLFQEKRITKRMYFFTAGFFICSAFNAGSFCMFGSEKNSIMATMLFIFVFVAVLLLLSSYKAYSPNKGRNKYSKVNNRNMNLLINGFLLYAMINIGGVMLEKEDEYIGISIILILAIIMLGIFTFISISSSSDSYEKELEKAKANILAKMEDREDVKSRSKSEDKL